MKKYVRLLCVLLLAAICLTLIPACNGGAGEKPFRVGIASGILRPLQMSIWKDICAPEISGATPDIRMILPAI